MGGLNMKKMNMLILFSIAFGANTMAAELTPVLKNVRSLFEKGETSFKEFEGGHFFCPTAISMEGGGSEMKFNEDLTIEKSTDGLSFLLKGKRDSVGTQENFGLSFKERNWFFGHNLIVLRRLETNKLVMEISLPFQSPTSDKPLNSDETTYSIAMPKDHVAILYATCELTR